MGREAVPQAVATRVLRKSSPPNRLRDGTLDRRFVQMKTRAWTPFRISQIRDEGQAHFENFIACVRSRTAEQLEAPLEDGHFSTTLCHLGNISYRLGRSVKFDGAAERFEGDEDADKLLSRTYRAPYLLPAKT